MRSVVTVTLILSTTLAACVREANKPPEQSGQSKTRPAERVALTDEEKLRSLGTDAAASEIGSLCLRLRAVYASGSFPTDLRKRCARAMLILAENSGSTPKSADEWVGLAREFGASSVAIGKTKRSVASGRNSGSKAEEVSSGPRIENESYANRDDARQARQFLASLPAACSGSRASASRDGAVTIRLSCVGDNNSMRGSIKIKNGLVTEIQ